MYGVTAALLDRKRRSEHCHWSFQANNSRKRLMILGKSLKRRRALVSLFVCACDDLDFNGEIVLTIVEAMLDEVAWLYNLRGNEYADSSGRLPRLMKLIRQQHSLQSGLLLIRYHHPYHCYSLCRYRQIQPRCRISSWRQSPSQTLRCDTGRHQDAESEARRGTRTGDEPCRK